jgi:3',5'-cyclic AMP phosphodiesterase CpdA
MAALSWLHLSDWHQGNKGKMDRQVVRDALLKDLSTLAGQCHQEQFAQLDFIVFSGDLAFRGLPGEYKLAQAEFLDPVLEVTNVPPDRVFMVPGNHDVDRSRLQYLPDLLAEFNDRSKIIETFEDPELRDHLLFPMRAYSDAVKEFRRPGRRSEQSAAVLSPGHQVSTDTRRYDPAYSSLEFLELAGKTVAILGLNSAWMCGQFVDSITKEVKDYGRLILGEHQFRKHVLELDKGHADLVITVMHHPFHWFSETEDWSKLEDDLLERCHFVLRGHEHKARVTVPNGTAGPCAIISAGAAYDRRVFPNGYNIVLTDFDSGLCTVYLRRYYEERQKFMKDAVITSEETPGLVSFPIPKYLGHQGNAQRPVFQAQGEFTGNPWSTVSPVSLMNMADVYRRQHERFALHYSLARMTVTANSLEKQEMPDRVSTIVKFRAISDPVYCHKVTLYESEGDFLGKATWCVRNSLGETIRTIDVPISDQDGSKSLELLLFFDPILRPGPDEYTLMIEEQVTDTMRPLRTSGSDELFLVPTRAEGLIERVELIISVPESFGQVEMKPSSKIATVGGGRLMESSEVEQPKLGFHRAYGWLWETVPGRNTFAVELSHGFPPLNLR